MKRRFLVSAVFLLVIIGVVLIMPANEAKKKHARVCFENNCFSTELASTPKEREQGLMFRNNMAQDEGMLFVFDQEGEYSFWMKNTLIPLDIIWLSEKKEVVFMAQNSQPCLADDCPFINSENKARYVLELNAGGAEKIGLKTGDRATMILSALGNFND